MILYAMIVRASDGMPLSASIETDNQPIVRDTKRYLKVLARQVKSMEDRCSLAFEELHVLHFTTTLGVSYMALCESKYPVVLAFSFLDELVKEFITTYTTRDVSAAQRPYSFIKFDAVVQKTRQRYNNPSSLATKINLSDLSLEIRLRPPHQVSLGDIRQPVGGHRTSVSNGMVLPSVSYPNTVSPPPKPHPNTWVDLAAMVLTAFCALINFVRGIVSLSQSRFEDYDGTSPFHGIAFIAEAFIQCSQIFLLLNIVRRHLFWAYVALLGLCVCNVSSWGVRDFSQILLHAALGIVVTLRTIRRRLRTKTPNYNV